MSAEETIAALRAELATAQETIATPTGQVAMLVERVDGLEGQRATTSRKSNKPLSSDGLAWVPRNRRGTSGKKRGGQQGRAGAHLQQMEDAPDHVVVRRSLVCPAYIGLLRGTPEISVERWQVVEVPPTRPAVTGCRGVQVRCPRCATLVTGDFPPDVTAPVQRGTRMRAAIFALTHQHPLPYRRVRAVLSDVLGCVVTEGTMAMLAQDAAGQLTTVEAALADALGAGTLPHNDETGLAVQGNRWWPHTASTARLTHDGVHPKRGGAATDEIGILPGFRGTSTHDN